jgi:mRNA interferase MazF
VSKRKYVPRRGDVIRLDFGAQPGHEQTGRRPALVLSPTEYNRRVGLVVVCPITNEAKGYPFEVALPAEEVNVSGVVLADQIKSLDWRERHADFVCTLGAVVLEDVVQKSVALIDPDEDEE